MYRFFVAPEACSRDTITIEGEDYNHMKNVLRLKIGDTVTVSDGADREYICSIEEYSEGRAIVRIEDVCGSNAELPTELTLYQGYPKGDKLETIVQKAVELGAVRIVPVMMKRSVVKLDDKKAMKKVERMNAIALSAAKQSKRSVIPVVDRVMTYEEALEDAGHLDMLILPYENAEGIQRSKEILHQVRGKKSVGVLIGPEGGFDQEEVETALKNGAECITLGHRILRTETAGMAVLSILMFELEDDE